MKQVLMEVRNLTRTYKEFNNIAGRGLLTAVNHVDFNIYDGEVLGLLGTSGCGKSTIAKMLCKIEKPDEGEIIYRGEDIGNLTERQFRPYRKDIQMIFQNPFDCLDPQMTIERQLLEALRIWKIGNKATRKDEIQRLCKECNILESDLIKKPAEFSGGQLQRIAIMRALLLKPKILIADEIVSALDVAVQNQILELLLAMKEKFRLTILFITHDLAVMKKMADRIMVMKEGRILEIDTFDKLNHSTGNSYFKELKAASYLFDSSVI